MRCAATSHRVLPGVALAGCLLVLGACGAQRSTLPPKPRGSSGFVALTLLARYPEVYAQAEVSTTGVVEAAGKHGFRLAGPGVATKIMLLPASRAAADLGRTVQVSGLFTVSFQAGYELALTTITSSGG